MKLNLGCNTDIKDGYVNIDIFKYDDRITVADCSKLQEFIPYNSVTEIIAKDVLEHLPYQTGIEALSMWCDLLVGGGKIFIQTTNFDAHINMYMNKIWDIRALNHMLFAGVAYSKDKVNEFDFHKSIYTEKSLCNTMTNKNVDIITVSLDCSDDLHMNAYAHNMNITITGIKR